MRLADAARRPLLWIIVAAAALRVAAVVSLRGDVSIRVPLLDALHYMQTATALAHGDGWPAGPHFMSPVYPFLLSGLFRAFPPSVLAVQWAQLFIGLATVLLVTLAAGRRSPKIGWIAGISYAFCGPAIAYENQVLMESLVGFSLALLLYLNPVRRDARWPALAAAGIAVGVAGAGRPTYLLLLPLIGWLALRADRDARPTPRGLAVLLMAAALVIAPQVLHNFRVTGRMGIVSTSGGLNLYIGNHAGAKGIYSQPPGLFLEKDPSGVRSASRMAGRALNPMDASDFYAKLAWEAVASDPLRAAKLTLRKAGYLIGPAEVPQIESFDQIRADHPLFAAIGWIGFPLFFTLAWLGWRADTLAGGTRRLAVAILVAGAAAHIVFFSTGRYRAAMLPALAVLAAPGVEALAAAVRKRGPRIRGLWPLIAPVVLMILAPRVDRREQRAWEFHQQGIRYEILGAPRAAAESYRAAIEADSSSGESWHNLAACEVRLGRLEAGAEHYARSLQFLGENPVALANIAVVYGRMGQDARAVEFFDRAVASDPADLGIRVDRGVALYRLGRQEEAFADWRFVASQNPDEPGLSQTLVRLVSIGAYLPPDLSALSRRN